MESNLSTFRIGMKSNITCFAYIASNLPFQPPFSGMSLLEFAFPIVTFQDISNVCAAICQVEFLLL